VIRRPLKAVRLAAEGTRVVVLGGVAPATGVITDVRTHVGLRPYEVTCDDGRVVFLSGCDLAREDDAEATPLGRRRAD
jgi:hypothetical protein